ncbi:uncharacterized protein N7483_009695 [Penicillium malachiteum]|uniref:uncharacterized protein n=1 Tax=Penicillium malachiteum TaxID=1324776 RepID=UPI00254994D8|nr:uncharacterized protein N7483_009695 [Penicillium malachiteum]KAJ5721761.1 hypothetical protein N7483_009695 [Penicillium malachiteum]
MHPYQKVETVDHDGNSIQVPVVAHRSARVQSWATRILALIVVVLSLTLAWGWHCYQELYKNVAGEHVESWKSIAVQKSPYTGLTFDTQIPYSHHTEYTSHNKTHADEMWESLSIDPMVIAPTKEWAKEKGLTGSWAFPWDSNRQIYFVKVFHQLHCLKVMRRTYHQLWAGEEASIPSDHIEHCLDSLRQDLMCKADDTPMPSLKLYNGGGEGQAMQCKDFDKLVAWTQAPERNACYKRLTDYQVIVHSVERYAFCPQDSEHYDAMESYFQKHGHYADPFSE